MTMKDCLIQEASQALKDVCLNASEENIEKVNRAVDRALDWMMAEQELIDSPLLDDEDPYSYEDPIL